jgi:hypothetical protein
VYQATIVLPDGTPVLSHPIDIEVGGKKAKIDSKKNGACALPALKIPTLPSGEINWSEYRCKLSGPEELTGKLIPLDGGYGVSFIPRITGTYLCQVLHQVSTFF